MRRLLLLFISMIILFSGCTMNFEPVSSTKAEINANPLVIKSFSFSHSGMSTDQIYSYSAEQAENDVHLYLELNAGNQIVDVVVAEPVLERLGEIAGKYRIDRWDGFHKTNDMVLDGEGFSLYIVLADGSTISAGGSNAFPENYGNAESDICRLFEDLIDQYGNLYSQTLSSDDLDGVMLSFHAKYGEEFFFQLMRKQTIP